MGRIQVSFVICLAAAYTAKQANGRECNAGQERGSDGQLHWVINEDPDGCTNLRMAGGLNMQRRVNPYVQKSVPNVTTQTQESTSARNNASPCEGLLPSEFATLNGDPKKRWPQEGFFNTPLERLEFSVQSTSNVFIDFIETNDIGCVIELGEQSHISENHDADVTIDVGITARFWVTYTNNKVKVGRDGEESPLMEAEIPYMNINYMYIIFDSDVEAEWQVHFPCGYS